MSKKNLNLLRRMLYSIFFQTVWKSIDYNPKWIKSENNTYLENKQHLRCEWETIIQYLGSYI